MTKKAEPSSEEREVGVSVNQTCQKRLRKAAGQAGHLISGKGGLHRGAGRAGKGAQEPHPGEGMKEDSCKVRKPGKPDWGT